MIGRIFGLSIVVTVLALVVAFVYGGWEAVALAAILGVLERRLLHVKTPRRPARCP